MVGNEELESSEVAASKGWSISGYDAQSTGPLYGDGAKTVEHCDLRLRWKCEWSGGQG